MGKKKKHTVKTQILVNKSNKEILKTNFTNGKTHDFRLFKESKIRVNKKKLTKDQKKENYELSSSKYDCKYPIVFIPKRRKKVIFIK